MIDQLNRTVGGDLVHAEDLVNPTLVCRNVNYRPLMQVASLVWERNAKEPRREEVLGFAARQFLEHQLSRAGVRFITMACDEHVRGMKLQTWTLDGKVYYKALEIPRSNGDLLIMTDCLLSLSEILDLLGLECSVSSDSELQKVMKYLKRLVSSHHAGLDDSMVWSDWAVFGTFLGSFEFAGGRMFKYELENGEIFQIFVNPSEYGTVTDGMGAISPDGVRKVTGCRGSAWSGYQYTLAFGPGFGKGHLIVRPHLIADMVVYGPQLKHILRSTGSLFLGFIRELHRGVAKTDVQSIINFRLWPELGRWADAFFESVLPIMASEDRIVEFLSRQLKGEPANIDPFAWKEDDPGYFQTHACESWTLMRALVALKQNRIDLKFSALPGLWRRVLNLLLAVSINFEQFRVPIPEDEAMAFYVMPDPFAFDTFGYLDKEEAELGSDEVHIPVESIGGGQLMYGYRRPNGHREECLDGAQACTSRFLDKEFSRSPFFFVSVFDIQAKLLKCGGGDNDDQFVVVFGNKLVNHILDLPAYPESDQAVVSAVAAPLNKWRVKVAGVLGKTCGFDSSSIAKLVLKFDSYSLSIGQVVNAIMVDTYLSELAEADPEFAKVHNITVYKLRRIARQLETVIDSVQKDGADISEFEALLEQFWAELTVLPKFLFYGRFVSKLSGERRIRVPRQHRDRLALVQVESLAERVIGGIKASERQFRDAMAEREWDQVDPQMFLGMSAPGCTDAIDLSKRIWSTYIEYMREFMQDSMTPDQKSEVYVSAGNSAFALLEEQFGNRVYAKSVALEAMLQLVLNTYLRHRDKKDRYRDGSVKHFPDGLLWHPKFALLTLRALAYGKRLGPRPQFESEYRSEMPSPVPAPSTVAHADLIVADGWQVKGLAADSSEVRAWVAKAGSKVTVQMGSFDGKAVPEVLLGGLHYGWVKNVHVIQPVAGILVPVSVSPFAMGVVLDKEPVTPAPVAEPVAEAFQVVGKPYTDPAFSGDDWNLQAGQEVDLVLTVFDDPKTGREDAVEVVLAGRHFGWLARVGFVAKYKKLGLTVAKGVLSAKTKSTMTVTVIL